MSLEFNERTYGYRLKKVSSICAEDDKCRHLGEEWRPVVLSLGLPVDASCRDSFIEPIPLPEGYELVPWGGVTQSGDLFLPTKHVAGFVPVPRYWNECRESVGYTISEKDFHDIVVIRPKKAAVAGSSAEETTVIDLIHRGQILEIIQIAKEHTKEHGGDAVALIELLINRIEMEELF